MWGPPAKVVDVIRRCQRICSSLPLSCSVTVTHDGGSNRGGKETACPRARVTFQMINKVVSTAETFAWATENNKMLGECWSFRMNY